ASLGPSAARRRSQEAQRPACAGQLASHGCCSIERRSRSTPQISQRPYWSVSNAWMARSIRSRKLRSRSSGSSPALAGAGRHARSTSLPQSTASRSSATSFPLRSNGGFRQRSVANPNYGRISTKANLINAGVGNVLDQRLKVVSREPWLGVREPLGGVGRVCSHAVVVQGFSIPSHSEFAHVSLFACRTAACASRRHCTRRMDAVLPFRRWLLLLRRFGPLLVAIELACATSSPRRMTRRIGAP